MGQEGDAFSGQGRGTTTTRSIAISGNRGGNDAVVSSTVKEDATHVRSERCHVPFNLFATVKIARKSDSGTAPYIMGNNPSNVGLGKGTPTRNSNPNRSLKPLREKLAHAHGVDQVILYAYLQ